MQNENECIRYPIGNKIEDLLRVEALPDSQQVFCFKGQVKEPADHVRFFGTLVLFKVDQDASEAPGNQVFGHSCAQDVAIMGWLGGGDPLQLVLFVERELIVIETVVFNGHDLDKGPPAHRWLDTEEAVLLWQNELASVKASVFAPAAEPELRGIAGALRLLIPVYVDHQPRSIGQLEGVYEDLGHLRLVHLKVVGQLVRPVVDLHNVEHLGLILEHYPSVVEFQSDYSRSVAIQLAQHVRNGGSLELDEHQTTFHGAYCHYGQTPVVTHGTRIRHGHFAQGVALREVHHGHLIAVQQKHALVLESLEYPEGDHRTARRRNSLQRRSSVLVHHHLFDVARIQLGVNLPVGVAQIATDTPQAAL